MQARDLAISPPLLAKLYGGARLVRAYYRFCHDDYKLALEDIEPAVAIFPDAPLILAYRGWLRYVTDDHDKAIVDFSEAIRLEPEDAWSHYARGLTWILLQNYDKAIDDFGEAIRIKPQIQAPMRSGDGLGSEK
jgi:tetratricopeptide (TPR) repeat protein